MQFDQLIEEIQQVCKKSHIWKFLWEDQEKNFNFLLTVLSIYNRLNQSCIDVIDPPLERETWLL